MASDWRSIGAETAQVGRGAAAVQGSLGKAAEVDLGVAIHVPMLAGSTVASVMGDLEKATDYVGSAASDAKQLSAELGADAQKLLAVAANYAEADSAVRAQLQSVLDRGLDAERKGGGPGKILSLLCGLDGRTVTPAPSPGSTPVPGRAPSPGPGPGSSQTPLPGPTPTPGLTAPPGETSPPVPVPSQLPKSKPHPPSAPRPGSGKGGSGGHGNGGRGSGGQGSGGQGSSGHGGGGRGSGGQANPPRAHGDPPGSPYYANQTQVLRWINEAFAVMEAHGVPASELDPWDVLLIIEHESSGNPYAINRTDINAQRGDPSRGLMQTIGATFNAYALPGYNGNIYDPVDNIIAGCRYAIATYGSLAAVPGVRAVKAGRPYVGY